MKCVWCHGTFRSLIHDLLCRKCQARAETNSGAFYRGVSPTHYYEWLDAEQEMRRRLVRPDA